MNQKPIIGIAGFGVEGRATYEYFRGKAEIHIFDEMPQHLDGIDAVFQQTLTIPATIPVVYKTPGIPTRKLILMSQNTRITTLMDAVLEKVQDRAIGVTGTKGKSTVVSLIHHILSGAGKNSVLMGNIGVADMRILEDDSPARLYVIELSSYQSEHLTHSPHIAVLTNLYPEHLTHHGSFEAYRKAKMNIARLQKPGDVFIDGRSIAASKPFKTKLIGEHNQKNCALALSVVSALDVSEEEARKHIATFKPLPYRLERVGEFNGITFYDDSLATVPEATLAALAALPRVTTLILGGEDRDIDFRPFATALTKTTISTFIIFPDTGAKMVTQVHNQKIIPVTSMQEAVRMAFQHTPQGGTVLLSNASPSFNIFRDYKDKSAQYRKWIQLMGT